MIFDANDATRELAEHLKTCLNLPRGGGGKRIDTLASENDHSFKSRIFYMHPLYAFFYTSKIHTFIELFYIQYTSLYFFAFFKQFIHKRSICTLGNFSCATLLKAAEVLQM